MGTNASSLRAFASARADAYRPSVCTAAVLQDMAVCVAEAVAAAYVFWARGEARSSASASSASSASPSAPSPAPPPSTPRLAGTLASRALLLPRLRATRALERFRNEVALSSWAHAQYGSVREIYEDRQPLWGVAPGGRLLRRELPVSRRGELDALSGWRRTVRRVCCTRAACASFCMHSWL
jgi:hypothetical protein